MNKSCKKLVKKLLTDKERIVLDIIRFTEKTKVDASKDFMKLLQADVDLTTANTMIYGKRFADKVDALCEKLVINSSIFTEYKKKKLVKKYHYEMCVGLDDGKCCGKKNYKTFELDCGMCKSCYDKMEV